MARLLGVVLMVVTLYICLMVSNPSAQTSHNHQDIATRLGAYGILTVGVGVLIVSGGIDLSIGSVVALTAVVFAELLQRGWTPWPAAGIVVLLGSFIGLIHGLLVTLLRVQPFLVTLCGLFIYRGLARFVSKDSSMGFTRSLHNRETEEMRKFLVSGSVGPIPSMLILLLLLALVLAILLHGTKYGRYLFAIGANEEAARYAGVPTGRYKVLAYLICSTLAGLGGVLYLLENRSAEPSNAGALYELYAITGAVLGGCSLRGGEGNLVGMILGAAALPLLWNICQFIPYGNTLEYVVIGTALLIGTITDELLKRMAARRG